MFCKLHPNWPLVEVAFLVALYAETQSLFLHLNGQQVQLVLKNLPTQLQDQQQELNLLKETVEKSFNDIKETITKHLFTIEYVLVDTLINECGAENDYTDVVKDVLTSVQKTEESLRSLKNLNSGAGGSTIASAVSLSNSIMSDDDKVRLQLRVDVLGWTGEISKLGFTTSDIDKLVDLNDMVQENIKLK